MKLNGTTSEVVQPLYNKMMLTKYLFIYISPKKTSYSVFEDSSTQYLVFDDCVTGAEILKYDGYFIFKMKILLPHLLYT